MLKNPKIAPRLAFATCGLFGDVEQAFEESKEYYEEQMKLAIQQKENYEKEVEANAN